MELLSSSPQLNRFTVKQQKLCKLEHLHTAGTHVQGFSSTSGRALRITSWGVECAVSPPWTGQDFTASSLQVAVLVTSLHFLHHLSSHWQVLNFPCYISAKLLRYKRNIWSPNQGHNTGPRFKNPTGHGIPETCQVHHKYWTLSKASCLACLIPWSLSKKEVLGLLKSWIVSICD